MLQQKGREKKMDHNEKILKILKGIRPEYDFSGSEDFIDDGLLDSFDIVTLVSDLESEYGIIIDGLDIIPDNFNSVEAIADIVRKNGGKA